MIKRLPECFRIDVRKELCNVTGGVKFIQGCFLQLVEEVGEGMLMYVSIPFLPLHNRANPDGTVDHDYDSAENRPHKRPEVVTP